MSIFRLIITGAGLLGAGALFGASLYDMVVLAPNLLGGPTGLEHGRLFMSAATPANLFRILSPATQLLLLVALVANWAIPQCRWPLACAFLALILGDVITFTYHYPRNHLMFDAPLTVQPELLSLAARQWATANLLRIALVLAGWLGALFAFTRLALSHWGSDA